MSELLGTAYVDVRPLTQGFEQQLKRDVQRSIDRVDAQLGRQTRGGVSAGMRAQIAGLLDRNNALRAQADEILASNKTVASSSDIAGASLAGAAAKASLLGAAVLFGAHGLQELNAKLLESDGRLHEVGRLLDGLQRTSPSQVGSAIDNLFGDRFEKDIDFALKGLFGIDRAAERLASHLHDVQIAAAAAIAEVAKADVAARIDFFGGDVPAFGEPSDRFGRGPGAIARSNALQAAAGRTFTALDAEVAQLIKDAAARVQATTDDVVDARHDLATTAAAARQAVSDALSSALSNFESLGNDLANDIQRLIDEGPLASRIDALRARLGASSDANQRRQLRNSVRAAKKELADAEGSIQIVGTLTQSDRQQIDAFLRPFRQKVKDAQAALAEFNTEGVLKGLEKTLAKQKETVQRGIEDIIARFEAGRISLPQVTSGIADEMARAGVANYRKAGDTLGFAFVRGFREHLDDLIKQAAAIRATPAGVKPSSSIVSPADVARDSTNAILQAQKRVQDTQLEQAKAQTELLKQINRKTPETTAATTPSKQPGANAGVSTIGPRPPRG